MMATLLPSYYYAATSNRDMAGGEHHHQRPCYAIIVDDLLPPSWLAHKTIEHSASADDIKIFFSYYVHRIIDK